MKNKNAIENILDQAIQKLKTGASLDAVLSVYPEDHREELARLLAVVKITQSLPIKFVPAPMKRRMFLQVAKKPALAYRIVEYFTTFKTVVPTALVVIALVLTGTVQAAKNSLPGDKLFTVRKSIEKMQVNLATNQKSKTNLELEFANARLEDAQKVLATSGDNETQQLAIAELKDQTNTALNNVKQNTPVAVNDPEVVKKLEELTQQQEKLISQKDSSEQKSIVADIKKIVAVSKEESGANIAAEKIDVTGNINFISLKNNYIKIDNNSFQINDNTVIQDKDGNAWKITDLGINDNVRIEGQVKDSQNNADKISVLSRSKGKPEAAKTEVKSETKIIAPKPTPAPAPKTDTQDDPVPDTSQDTFGGVIIEPPPPAGNF